MIMISQLSDWFPKPMIWAIIVKFNQIRKNWWRISCAEILEVEKNFFAASSVKKMSRFAENSPDEIKRIAWKFTKTVILLGLAGYELIITTASLVIYISSYPGRPRRITVNYNPLINFCGLSSEKISTWYYLGRWLSEDIRLRYYLWIDITERQYWTNRKRFPCFYRVIETRVEVWGNEKCCWNTSRRLFRVLPNLHECFYN